MTVPREPPGIPPRRFLCHLLRLPTPVRLFWVGLLVVSPSISHTQEQGTRDTVYHIPPVTVTATRTREVLLEVPLAISVVPAPVLANSRRYGLDEVLAFVPGVLAQSRSGGIDSRITIRGFGARGNGDRSNAGTIRGIRVLVDGFPVSEPDGRTSLDLIDLWSAGSVEVIRSNASALYGGAAGGVLDITSRRSPSRLSADLGAVTGSHGLRAAMGSVSAPVGTGHFAFSASNTIFDGWREHSAGSRTLANGLLISPLGETSNLSVQVIGASNFFKIPGPLTRAQFQADPRQADSTYRARDERRNNLLARIGIRLDHAMGELHEISIMAFGEQKVLERSERNTYRDFDRYHLGGTALYRLRLEPSPSLRAITLLGLDEAYQNGSSLFYNLEGGNRGSTLRANKAEGANTFGLFVQEEVMVGEVWSFLAGGRYDILTYGADDFIEPTLAATKTFSEFTPKLGASFRWMPTQTIYGSLGGGLEVPAYNEMNPPPPLDTSTALNPLLDPMRSQTYELGAKGIVDVALPWLQSLTYDLALYHITITNDLVPLDGGAYFLTAGESVRDGIELGLTARSAAGVSLQLAFSASRNRYVEYRNELGDFSGNAVPGLPATIAALGLRYDSPWNVFLEAGLQSIGSYYADDANSAEGHVDGVTVVRAALGGRLTAGPLSLDLYCGLNNLTDRRYVSSVFINGVPAGSDPAPRFFEAGLPRNIFANITLRYLGPDL